jgi:DEAD/DEAH box helicase domain-containing protein
MSQPIIFDVETQRSFQEVGNRIDKLGVSVVAVYNYTDSSYQTFFEKDLNKLFSLFDKASLLIGFNSRKFDLEVLKPYYVGDLTKIPHLDLMEEIQKTHGKRLALDALVKGTLGLRKQGHGFLALNYFKEGKLEELAKYCISDVKLTKELFEYGQKHKKVFYEGPYGKIEIKVNWDIQAKGTDINLTLPI